VWAAWGSTGAATFEAAPFKLVLAAACHVQLQQISISKCCVPTGTLKLL
jgi:hypothetical protein